MVFLSNIITLWRDDPVDRTIATQDGLITQHIAPGSGIHNPGRPDRTVFGAAAREPETCIGATPHSTTTRVISIWVHVPYPLQTVKRHLWQHGPLGRWSLSRRCSLLREIVLLMRCRTHAAAQHPPAVAGASKACRSGSRRRQGRTGSSRIRLRASTRPKAHRRVERLPSPI